MKFEIDMSNLLRRLDKMSAMKTLPQKMEQACALVEKDAKKRCPVDTGNLRNSIASRVEETDSEVAGIIYSTVDYAPFVEFGTLTQKAQPYMIPAVTENRTAITSYLQEAISDG